jgi:hypothetical protein
MSLFCKKLQLKTCVKNTQKTMLKMGKKAGKNAFCGFVSIDGRGGYALKIVINRQETIVVSPDFASK